MGVDATRPAFYETCLYTKTHDWNFIVDWTNPQHRNVLVLGGFSGHGFKLAPLMGKCFIVVVVALWSRPQQARLSRSTQVGWPLVCFWTGSAKSMPQSCPTSNFRPIASCVRLRRQPRQARPRLASLPTQPPLRQHGHPLPPLPLALATLCSFGPPCNPLDFQTKPSSPKPPPKRELLGSSLLGVSQFRKAAKKRPPTSTEAEKFSSVAVSLESGPNNCPSEGVSRCSAVSRY